MTGVIILYTMMMEKGFRKIETAVASSRTTYIQ